MQYPVFTIEDQPKPYYWHSAYWNSGVVACCFMFKFRKTSTVWNL